MPAPHYLILSDCLFLSLFPMPFFPLHCFASPFFINVHILCLPRFPQPFWESSPPTSRSRLTRAAGSVAQIGTDRKRCGLCMPHRRSAEPPHAVWTCASVAVAQWNFVDSWNFTYFSQLTKLCSYNLGKMFQRPFSAVDGADPAKRWMQPRPATSSRQ